MMRRFALGFVLGTVVGLVGCDDSKPTKVDGGQDAATPMCMGTFAFATRAQLGEQSNSAGACAAAADLDVICDNDVGGRVRALGVGCFAANPMADGQALAACTLMELKQDTVPDPTDGCYACYLAVTGCTLANCRTECAADANAMPCTTCQFANGCLTAFYQCSGLATPPGLSVPDGGTGTETD